MKYKVIDFIKQIEKIAPLSSQESYDNSGLIVGDKTMKVTGVLFAFDCTEEIIAEAIEKGANLIVAHHPIVFNGIKKLNGKNYVERTVIKAIKNDIAIYAAHTNMDNSLFGVNQEMARRMGVENPIILSPVKGKLKKLVFFCPDQHVEHVKNAIFKEGGGNIGTYSNCSFEVKGTGQFIPTEGSNPTKGTIGNKEQLQEKRVEIIIRTHDENRILQAMKDSHPYETVAFELYPISNMNQNEGAGMIGYLKQPLSTLSFLERLKERFNCGCIRHTKIAKDKVQKIAFCGGSGSFLIQEAIAKEADIFITGDVKYHDFFYADNQIVIADIGHFESEQYTPHLIFELLQKKFINFALYLSTVNTNPINYY